MSNENIILTKLSDPSIPSAPFITSNSLVYIEVNGIGYSTTIANLSNSLSGVSGGNLPPGSQGFGIIYEGGNYVARRLNYTDLDGVPIPSPFNENISVTFEEGNGFIRVNENAESNQQYIIKTVTYTLPAATQTFPISPLVTPTNERIDLIVLRENSLVEYRQGTEGVNPISPGVNGDELILVQILVTSSGNVTTDTSSNINFINGLTLSGSTAKLGGILTETTSINPDIYNLEIGGLTINSTTTDVNNLRLTGLIRDNLGNAPTVQGQSLVFTGGQIIWSTATSSEIEDIRTLTGTAIGDTDLGSFLGTTISDNVTIKVALQELETALGSVGGNTNLSTGNLTATTLDVISDTGTDATLPSATTLLAGLLSAADKTKIDTIAGSYIQGSVLFIGASNAITEDNSEFFYDDVNNRLGLGTTSPNSKLYVIDSTATSDGDDVAIFRADGIDDTRAVRIQRGVGANHIRLRVGNELALEGLNGGTPRIVAANQLEMVGNRLVVQDSTGNNGYLELKANATIDARSAGGNAGLAILNSGTTGVLTLNVTAESIFTSDRVDNDSLSIVGLASQTSNLLNIEDDSNTALVTVEPNGTVRNDAIRNFTTDAEADADGTLTDYSYYRIGTDLRIKTPDTTLLKTSQLVYNVTNLAATVTFQARTTTNTFVLEEYEVDTTDTFTSVSYAYRDLGSGEGTTYTPVGDVDALNTAVNGLAQGTLVEVQLGHIFQVGRTQGTSYFTLHR